MKSCKLRIGDDGQRRFGMEGSLAEYYSKTDREDLEHIAGTACREICQEIFAEYEEKMLKIIRNNHDASSAVISKKLCNDTAKMCLQKDILPYIEKETQRRLKWINRKEAEERKKKEEEEKKRKQEEEEANRRKAEEEKARAEAEAQPDANFAQDSTSVPPPSSPPPPSSEQGDL
eukprot:PhF_6_TR7185/c0_g1_i1/m.10737